MKFKLDDWIRVTEGHAKGYVFKVTGLLGTETLLGPCFNYKAECCELWQPQPRELCWFWDNCTPHRPTLREYGDFPTGYDEDNMFHDSEQNPFDCCEPFIGELPTIYK